MLRVPDAEGIIGRYRRRTGHRLAVLDDDPTGSQAVHGVSVVTVPDVREYAAALADPGDTCFVLTNSRALDQAAAVAVHTAAGRDLFGWAAGAGVPLDVVSRGDSTLRGHVTAEVAALADARLAVTGTPPDGVLFCPAMPEAGRTTVGTVHRAVVAGVPTPVGRTEFARDPVFGYTSSDLRAFLAERSGGRIAAASVLSLSLTDIRVGGPQRVGAVLSGVSGQRWVVVDAADPADLAVVALGLYQARDAGRSLLVRSGPSFVRAMAGIGARAPLAAADVPVDAARCRYGLVVVGSHVALTSRQLGVLRRRGDLAAVELDVPTLLDPQAAPGYLATAAAGVITALAGGDVLVHTSRTVVTSGGGLTGLAVSRAVSAALVELVRRVRPARPAWVLAKGGITGHDLAAKALGIRRAVVVGQFLPGQISLLAPVDAPADVLGCPFVVFPGNVGGDDALAMVCDRLAAASARAAAGDTGAADGADGADAAGGVPPRRG